MASNFLGTCAGASFATSFLGASFATSFLGASFATSFLGASGVAEVPPQATSNTRPRIRRVTTGTAVYLSK